MPAACVAVEWIACVADVSTHQARHTKHAAHHAEGQTHTSGERLPGGRNRKHQANHGPEPGCLSSSPPCLLPATRHGSEPCLSHRRPLEDARGVVDEDDLRGAQSPNPVPKVVLSRSVIAKSQMPIFSASQTRNDVTAAPVYPFVSVGCRSRGGDGGECGAVPGCTRRSPDGRSSFHGLWPVEPAGITSSARQRQSWACPTALAGASEGQLLQSRALPRSSRAAAQQQHGTGTRPIVVTSDPSRPSNPPSFQVPIRLAPSLLPPVLSLLHPNHAPPAASHRIVFLSELPELPSSICWKPTACTPSRLQAIESESLS